MNRSGIYETSRLPRGGSEIWDTGAGAVLRKAVFDDPSYVPAQYTKVHPYQIWAGSSNTPATSFATSQSNAVPAGQIVLFIVSNRTNASVDPVVPSLVSSQMTFELVDTRVWDDTSASRKRTSIFKAVAPFPILVALSPTISTGSQSNTSVVWSGIVLLGAAKIGQIVNAALPVITTEPTFTASFPSPTSPISTTVAIFSDDDGSVGPTIDGDYANLSLPTIPASGPTLRSYYRHGSETDVTVTTGLAGALGLFLIEALPTNAVQAAVADGNHSVTSTEPSITASGGSIGLVIGSGVSAHVATSPSIAANSDLAIDSSAHGHIATGPTIVPKSAITPASASHAHTASSPSIATASPLTIAGASHTHSATGPTVIPRYSIAPAAGVHAHSATSPTIGGGIGLAVQGASHAFTDTVPSIAARSTLTIQPGLHGLIDSPPSLLSESALTIANAAHALSSSSPTIAANSVLAIADGLHVHVASSPTIEIRFTLSPADASHQHTASSPAMSVSGSLSPAAGSHDHIATEPVVKVYATLLYDSFTDTAGTALTAHAPEIGGQWKPNPSFPTGASIVAGGSIAGGSTASSTIFYNDVGQFADFDATIVCSATSLTAATAYPAIVFRQNVSGAATFYQVTIQPGEAITINFQRLNSGTVTELGSVLSTTFNPAINTDYRFRVRCVGNRITVWVNEVQYLNVFDGSPLPAGFFGFKLRGNGRIHDMRFVSTVSEFAVMPSSGTHQHIATSPAVLPSIGLLPTSGLHAVNDTAPTLAARSSLTVQAAQHGHSATSPTVSVGGTLAPSPGLHALTDTPPAISAKAALLVNGSTHAHAAKAPTVSAKSALAVQSGQHPLIDAPPALVPRAALSIAAGAHSTTSTGPTIVPFGTLSVQPAAHGHSATSPTISSRSVLVIDGTGHAHIATSPALGSGFALGVASGLHSAVSTQPSISTRSALAPDGATHGHTATSLSLSGASVIAIAAAVHGHLATSPTVAARYAVQPADGLHSMASTSPALTAKSVLAANDAYHAHNCDVVLVTTAESNSGNFLAFFF